MILECRPGSRNALSTFLLIGILLLGLLIRLDHFTARWSDYFVPGWWSHLGWSGAVYSIIGRNYLRYGFATYLGPVVSTGLLPSDQLVFYGNHPPLLGWLIAMSFAVFGEHEWATRLVPLLFSLGGLVVMYALVTQHFDRGVGLLATLLMAVVPMAAYYLGAFPVVEGAHVLFFMLLSFFWYFRWIDSGKRGHFVGLALAVCFGILSDWPGLYIPLVIVTYHGFTQRRDKLLALIILSAASVVFILALIWYLSWLVHDPWIIPKAFLPWSIASKSGSPNTSSLLFTILDWITTVLGTHILYLYTPVVLSLAVSYLIVRWFRVGRSPSPHRSHLVWMLLIFGSLHPVLGLRGAALHNYWSMYLTPGLVLAAALWLNDLSDPQARRSLGVRATSLFVSCTVGLLGLYHVAETLDWRASTGYLLAILLLGLVPFIPERTLWRRWDAATMTIALGLVCFVLAAYGQTRMIWRRDNEGGLGAYHAAKVLRERTSPAEEILAGPSIAFWGHNPPLTYYADRQFIQVDSIETLAAYQTERRFRYLILSEKAIDKDLAAHVAPRFYAEAVDGYLLVNLRRPL